MVKVNDLIPPEIRSVVRHASRIEQYGCSGTSDSFADYAFDLIGPAGSLRDDFNPCDFIGEIQMALFPSTSSLNENASFTDLIVLPSALESSLLGIFGNQTVLDGTFLLDTLGNLSARQLINFIKQFFPGEDTPGRRRLKQQEKSQILKRGGVIKAVQNAINPLQFAPRSLSNIVEEDPFLQLQVNELLSFSFGIDFGGAKKLLRFGVNFDFESDDGASDTIQNLLESFMADTIGDNASKETEAFSFSKSASELAADLKKAIVINAEAKIDIAFRLDLTELFDSGVAPTPFVQIDTFYLSGVFGVNEWSTKLTLDDFDVSITDAKALVNIEAYIP